MYLYCSKTLITLSQPCSHFFMKHRGVGGVGPLVSGSIRLRIIRSLAPGATNMTKKWLTVVQSRWGTVREEGTQYGAWEKKGRQKEKIGKKEKKRNWSVYMGESEIARQLFEVAQILIFNCVHWLSWLHKPMACRSIISLPEPGAFCESKSPRKWQFLLIKLFIGTNNGKSSMKLQIESLSTICI